MLRLYFGFDNNKLGLTSTTEAEYVSMTKASKEMILLKDFLEESDLKQEDSVLYSDSYSAIDLTKNLVYLAKIKHIDVRYHFIRKILEDGGLLLEKILEIKILHMCWQNHSRLTN